ncbi:MAG: Holliday junction branch migration protein RuvA [Gammaproteobacteria bacterium]|nr:Holliday junction branch migration protein RuvA [Gammaproteobacteria bacterium]
MIGRLQGTLIYKQPPHLMIDCGGIGYEVDAPMSTFYDLPAAGETVTLWTHMVVREDDQRLIGFSTEGDRRLFRQLIRINGVGAKLALTILSGISIDAFVECVREDDIVTLTRLPGVGKKTAERLIIEMRDKIDSMATGELPASSTDRILQREASSVEEAVHALQTLGYKANEASRMVGKVDQTATLETEEIIRLALQITLKK